jgi:hypothetical protein
MVGMTVGSGGTSSCVIAAMLLNRLEIKLLDKGIK